MATLTAEVEHFSGTPLHDALAFCVSSIIVKVSNQDSDTRYAFRDKGKSAADVYSHFLASARKLAAMPSPASGNVPAVINKNSLLLADGDFPGPIGMVVTSPPYPNAYEYWLYHKYRMYWLGFNPLKVKEEEIGTRSAYFKKGQSELRDFASQMESLLANLYPRCANGAFLCFVIGRSKIHGEIIRNEEIIGAVGERVGYRRAALLQREINSKRKSFNPAHARIQEEYIVILQK